MAVVTMTRAKAAAFLGISERTLMRYTDQGKIQVQYFRGKTNKVPIYHQADVERLKVALEQPIAHKPALIPPTKPEEKALTKQRPVVLSPDTVSGLSEQLGNFLSAITTLRASYKLTLSLADAAAVAGLSKDWLARAIHDKKLKAEKRGRGWNIKRADLESYIRKL